MRYFKISEFDSPDLPGSGSNMDPAFLERLDLIREDAGIPFNITSGYRTKDHNSKVGGKQDSAHTLGLAVDIAAPSGSEKFAIVNAAIENGIRRIGIGKTFVHIDHAVATLPWPVIWTY